MAANQVLQEINPFSKAEQHRMLGEARDRVKHIGQTMKRSMDAGELKDVITHAKVLLEELRTSLLTPKNYYELYVDIFDQLGFLERYFLQLQRNGMAMSELYDLVQQAGHVLSRLYLMITVASVYMKCGQITPRAMLADLLEMVKGVQYPQRGLFLRYYLSQKCKDKLPDTGNPFDGAGGSVQDSIDFVITNFCEMNRLWVRMQTTNIVRSKRRREKERLDLRVLVGSNITRLSQLNGLDVHRYDSEVLPRLLSEVVACKDRIAQQYILESIIQVFPVEYHYATLTQLLDALRQIVPDHEVCKTTIQLLLTRIQDEAVGAKSGSSAAASGSAAGSGSSAAVSTAPDRRVAGLPADVDVFQIILSAIRKLGIEPNGSFRKTGSGGGSTPNPAGSPDAAETPIETPVEVDPLTSIRNATALAGSGDAIAALIEVYTSFLKFTIACYPGNTDYCNTVLGDCVNTLRIIFGIAAVPGSSAAGFGASGAAGGVEDTVKVITATTRSALSRLTGGAGDADAAATPAEETTPNEVGVSMGAATPTAASGAASAGGRTAARGAWAMLTDECSSLLVTMLGVAQSTLGLQALMLDNYAVVLSTLRYRYRLDVANALVDAVLQAGLRVKSPELARRLCTAATSLLRDDTGAPAEAEEEQSTFTAQQLKVARLIHLMGGTTDASVANFCRSSETEVSTGDAHIGDADADTDTHYQVFVVLRDFLSHGGARRIRHTSPPLVFGCLQLVHRIRARAAAGKPGRITVKKVFQFAHDLCTGLAVVQTELALRLFLECAAVSDTNAFTSEFLGQALIMYEDIAESKAQVRCLSQVMATLHNCTALNVESYENFVSRCSTLCIKLLRKPDQVRCILACARLFWGGRLEDVEQYRRPNELLQCLIRALKIADSCMPPAPELFAEILSAYVFFFDEGCQSIKVQNVSDMVTLAASNIEAISDVNERAAVRALVKNTVQHIRLRMTGAGRERYVGFVFPDGL